MSGKGGEIMIGGFKSGEWGRSEVRSRRKKRYS